MDPVWNKIYHALGAPDSIAVARIFDPEDTGAVGREKFIEILRVSFLSEKELCLSVVFSPFENAFEIVSHIYIPLKYMLTLALLHTPPSYI
jgi:hypothetical protein